MIERKSDRWIGLTQAILLHAAVIGALAYGFYAYQKQSKPVTPTLAIEGTVVSEQDLQPVKPAATPLSPPPEPEPPPPEPVEDVGPPSPTPEEVAQRAQEEQQKQEEARRAEEARIALEKKEAEEKAAAEQRAREEAERKRQEEEQKRIAEAKRQAEEKRKAEEAKRKAEEEKARAAREADLRRSLEAEERLNALRSSSAMSSWIGQITAKITRAWIRPPSAKPGIDCVVHVTQVPGGAVTSVKVGDCNGDAAVRQSIEDAVIRASPLPPPPDPALFERELEIRFKPQD